MLRFNLHPSPRHQRDMRQQHHPRFQVLPVASHAEAHLIVVDVAVGEAFGSDFGFSEFYVLR